MVIKGMVCDAALTCQTGGTNMARLRGQKTEILSCEEITKMRRVFRAVAILSIALSAAPLGAQDRQPTDEQRRKAEELRHYVKANYTKYEYMAPTPDG